MAGLEALAKLPKPQRQAVLALHGKAEFQKCQDDPLYWLDASRHMATPQWPQGLPYVFTMDPHRWYKCNYCGSEVVEARREIHQQIVHLKEVNTLRTLREDYTILPAIRAFTLMEYMPPIVEAWLTSQFFAIEKSRDMMATWLMIALFTWDSMFHEGRQQILQSEDAVKTLELVQRAYFIYRQTPKFLRDAIGKTTFSKGNAKSGELFFLDQKSEVIGLPQGEDQIRQYHPSGVFSDEAAFQLEAGPTFKAIKPAILEGGRYSMISTANRSWFEQICRDRLDE